MARNEISPALAKLLYACALMNLGGALTFAPPLPQLRAQVGLPEPQPMYLWILSIWILIFGLAFFKMARTRRLDSTFLAVSAAGKAVFSLALIAAWRSGDIPLIGAASGLPDLLLAGVFAWILIRP